MFKLNISLCPILISYTIAEMSCQDVIAHQLVQPHGLKVNYEDLPIWPLHTRSLVRNITTKLTTRQGLKL